MDSYDVLELVGEGSFGRVFKGNKKHSGQVVALKFIPKFGRTEKELRSLKREIEIMTGLQHPNIVQLYDSYDTGSEVVVVTEFAEGQLFQLLEEYGSFPERQVQMMACQLVSALYYLHSHRILHRDMKPQNILRANTGVVKLCDFGFARAMSVSTMVVTSIKGTPLYMSPELVEEKPYDHTADLWSLGCILYELHTGAPPFYTHSFVHLVKLIVRNEVKWPETMSDLCTDFLKGLLTKDPEERLSWPRLLHHPFVADDVLILSDPKLFRPLTVPPSPDLLDKKQKQVAEKWGGPGRSRLWQKVQRREDEAVKQKRLAAAMPVRKGGDVSEASDQSVPAPSPPLNHRARISRDYDQEFLWGRVGARPDRKRHQDAQDEDLSDVQSQQKVVLRHVKSKMMTFNAQLTAGCAAGEQILQPLDLLRALIPTSDLGESHLVAGELGLPQLLFQLVHGIVQQTHLFQRRWCVPALGGATAALLLYWERHRDWADAEHRLDDLSRPFQSMLREPLLRPLAPLSAAVLCLLLELVDVHVEVESLTFLLKALVTEPWEFLKPLPSSGLCDGLLTLLLHSLSEKENSSSLTPEMFLYLWDKINTELSSSQIETYCCSLDGVCSFLSSVSILLTEDPNSCIPLFTASESKCVCVLSLLLNTDCLPSPSKDDEGLSERVCLLSVRLLCFPLALDLPPLTVGVVLQLYQRAGLLPQLLQAVQRLPLSLLELPLALLSRLLLLPCEDAPSARCPLAMAAGFFCAPPPQQQQRPPHTPTVSSLLSDLLQQDALWDAAVELLNVLSHVARCSFFRGGRCLRVEGAVLQQTIAHCDGRIRAAACRLLANSFMCVCSDLPQSYILQALMESLRSRHPPVRRAACRALGNWLGVVAESARVTAYDRKTDDCVSNRAGEGWRWTEVRAVAAALAALVTDADAATQRHCCAALGNLGNLLDLDGNASLLSEDHERGGIRRAARDDGDAAARRDATLSLGRRRAEPRPAPR